jgi:hypothetical protein
MNMYTVTERDMLTSMIVYLEDEGKTELSAILQVSRFVAMYFSCGQKKK